MVSYITSASVIWTVCTVILVQASYFLKTISWRQKMESNGLTCSQVILDGSITTGTCCLTTRALRLCLSHVHVEDITEQAQPLGAQHVTVCYLKMRPHLISPLCGTKVMYL